MDVILIAAVSANGMIAHHSDEVVDWSEDLHLFREQTRGQTVIMGSNTAKTLATDLDGREVITMHRDMDPEEVLRGVTTEKCFVIGGAHTFSRFARQLTHVYLTYHPVILASNSLPLFSGLTEDIRLSFLRKKEVDGSRGIYQFQYVVLPVSHQ